MVSCANDVCVCIINRDGIFFFLLRYAYYNVCPAHPLLSILT